MNNLKKQVDKEGYVAISSVFSPEEIDDIAERVTESAKKNIESDFELDLLLPPIPKRVSILFR